MSDQGLSEDEAWEISLNEHPEFRRAWEEGRLPEEVVDEDGEVVNPKLHLSMHATVERQLSADDPKGVAEIARALEELGLSRHQIRHEMGRSVATQMWYMLQEGCDFDEQQYLSELRRIVDSYR